MTCEIVNDDIYSWGGSADDEGQRTFWVEHLVKCDVADGPFSVMNTPGLPEPGDEWNFGNDSDIWAYCLERKEPVFAPNAKKDGEACEYWLVRSHFSTKPPPNAMRRCQDEKVEDPLLEPAKVTGGFVKYTEEAFFDRYGFPIQNSAHELLRGPQVEFDRNRPSIKIEQNVATPFQAYVLPAQMVDCVNMFPIWGFPARCVKLSNAPWERVFYGRCGVYYKRTLEFDICHDTFDRDLLDEGNKVLNGRWVGGRYELLSIDGQTPNQWNPAHFVRFKDRHGENTRVILNGSGVPAGVEIIGRVLVGPYPAVDRASSTLAARNAATRAAAVALSMRQLQIAYRRIAGDFPALGGLENFFTQATNAANAYEQAARYAASVSTGANASAAARDAEAAAGAFMNLIEPLKDDLQGFASLPQQRVQDLVLNSNNVANNAVEALRVSHEARLEVERVDALGPGTGTGTSSVSSSTSPGRLHVEKYNDADFLLLGVPIFF